MERSPNTFFEDSNLNRLFSYVVVSTKLSDRGSGGASFHFEHRMGNELFLPIKLDGGLFACTSGKKADFLIYYKKLGANKTKIVVLELKSRADTDRAEKQIEDTIKTIHDEFKFMLPNCYEILKVVKFNRKSPKRRRGKDILYITEDKTLVNRLRED